MHAAEADNVQVSDALQGSVALKRPITYLNSRARVLPAAFRLKC